ncbi:hypothetical protein [Sphingomonas sp. NFR04]|uniref:hypothetical protein n=1 Tax=Sphingomonas sp. NFR04 TaxID=1566283 RepID=UPI001C319C92|nr:hypothetical protein [Sphingomonas sp. NFR04]
MFELRAGDGSQFGGTLDMGNDYALTLRGTVEPGSTDGPIGFHIIGLGIDNTPTAGWRYDYRGVTSVAWPNAVAQIPCLLGTVIRVHPHGPSAPAGVTASFIAVRQPGGPGSAPAPQGEATP